LDCAAKPSSAWGDSTRRSALAHAFGPATTWDLELRLLKGWHVYECATLAAIHDGFSTVADGRAHSRANWYAMGAVCARPIRAGHPAAVGLGLWQLGAHATAPDLMDLLSLRRPHGLGRVPAFHLASSGD
jgi:hypothetical protein